jgi:gamma-glutamylcyclotransferase (GGCT)/AIG2-like uncharacterized protein YtfP
VQVFCYGTLMLPDVWVKVVGRQAESVDAFVMNYACRRLRGVKYPGLRPQVGARTAGTLYRGVDERDLERLDRYEGEAYQRRLLPVWLASRKREMAWCYTLRKPHLRRLTQETWSAEHFARHHLKAYLEVCQSRRR